MKGLHRLSQHHKGEVRYKFICPYCGSRFAIHSKFRQHKERCLLFKFKIKVINNKFLDKYTYNRVDVIN